MKPGERKLLFGPDNHGPYSDTFYLPVGGQITVTAMGLSGNDEVTFEIVLVPALDEDICPCPPFKHSIPTIAATAPLLCCDDPVRLHEGRPTVVIDAPQNSRFRARLTAASPSDVWVFAAGTETKHVTKDMRGCNCPVDCTGITADVTHVEDGSDRFTFHFTGTAVPGTSAIGIDDWTWDFGDGVPVSGQTASHTFAQPGVHVVALTVKDDSGCEFTRIHLVTIYGCDGMGASFTHSGVGLNYSFAGQGVPSVGASIVDWRWDFGDGGASTQQNPAYSFSSPGTYLVSLTAVDSRGCSAVYSENVTVADTCAGINASFIYNVDGQGVTVNAAGSSPSAGANITSWHWTWGDGSNGSGMTPGKHTYAAPGVYTITLTIQDSNGCSHSTHHTVNIVSVQCAGINANFTLSNAGTLQATVVDSSSPSTGATLNSWLWNWGDGNTSSGVGPHTHTYAASGFYTVTLTIQDDEGCTAQTSRSITVHDGSGGDCMEFTVEAVAPPGNNHRVGMFSVWVDVTGDCQPVSVTMTVDGGSPIPGVILPSGGLIRFDFAGFDVSDTTGPYNLEFTVVDDCDCTSKFSDTLSIGCNEDDNVTITEVGVDGTEATLSVGQFSLPNGCTAGTVNWYLLPDTSTPIGSGTTLVHDFGAAGTYTVMAKMTDGCGCEHSGVEEIEIEEEGFPDPQYGVLENSPSFSPAEMDWKPDGTWEMTRADTDTGSETISGRWSPIGVIGANYQLKFTDLAGGAEQYFNSAAKLDWTDLNAVVSGFLTRPAHTPPGGLSGTILAQVREKTSQTIVSSYTVSLVIRDT